MRVPKKQAAPKLKKKKGSGKAKEAQEEGGAGAMADEQPGPSNRGGNQPRVWRPGVDSLEDDEQLDYDPTAYDCLHQLSAEWPSLSFDILRDNLGAPRSAFPHTLYMVAGTQAPQARQNYIALMKLTNLGTQGGAPKKANPEESDDDDMEDEDEDEQDPNPPKMHVRQVQHQGAINRIRAMPQQPGVIATWSETGHVNIYDLTQHLSELEGETGEPKKQKQPQKLNPRHQFAGHGAEGFAIDWSPMHAGRMATGDCRNRLHIWEPQQGGKWAVGNAQCTGGHTASVEDIQWSPTEETVLASCSVDKTIRIWDTRMRTQPMISVNAHDSDVNVISWNRMASYMLASGADDGSLRIWDLRSFKDGGYVANFVYHKSYVTSVEWCPYESSMLASSGADNQIAVWDMALERDPEEEAQLGAEVGGPRNAELPEDIPPQLMFVHMGQNDIKELHWHAQIPGMMLTTSLDGFNIFKPSNL